MILVWVGSMHALWPSLSPGCPWVHRAGGERTERGCACWRGILVGKTHAVVLPALLWSDLVAYRADADDDAPVFASRKGGGHLDRSQVLRIVQQAARRARIRRKVSPHWFRHAHASHAMDRGAPIHVVSATLAHSSIAITGRYLHAKPTESSAKFLAV